MVPRIVQARQLAFDWPMFSLTAFAVLGPRAKTEWVEEVRPHDSTLSDIAEWGMPRSSCRSYASHLNVKLVDRMPGALSREVPRRYVASGYSLFGPSDTSGFDVLQSRTAR